MDAVAKCFYLFCLIQISIADDSFDLGDVKSLTFR